MALALSLLGRRFSCHNVVKKNKGHHLSNPEAAYLMCWPVLNNILWMKILGSLCIITILTYAILTYMQIENRGLNILCSGTILISLVGCVCNGLAWIVNGGPLLRKTGTLKVAKTWVPFRKLILRSGLTYHVTKLLFPIESSQSNQEENDAKMLCVLESWDRSQFQMEINLICTQINDAFEDCMISLAESSVVASHALNLKDHEKHKRMLGRVLYLFTHHYSCGQVREKDVRHYLNVADKNVSKKKADRLNPLHA